MKRCFMTLLLFSLQVLHGKQNALVDELVAADVRLGSVFVDLLQQFRRQPDGNLSGFCGIK